MGGRRADCELASVAGEVSVGAVDHRHAGAHVARGVEGTQSRAQRDPVARVFDAARVVHPDLRLRRVPVAAAGSGLSDTGLMLANAGEDCPLW